MENGGALALNGEPMYFDGSVKDMERKPIEGATVNIVIVSPFSFLHA